MKKCDKCSNKINSSSFITEGGVVYELCDTCILFLKDVNQTGGLVQKFIGHKKVDKVIRRNMKEMREIIKITQEERDKRDLIRKEEWLRMINAEKDIGKRIEMARDRRECGEGAWKDY